MTNQRRYGIIRIMEEMIDMIKEDKDWLEYIFKDNEETLNFLGLNSILPKVIILGEGKKKEVGNE